MDRYRNGRCQSRNDRHFTSVPKCFNALPSWKGRSEKSISIQLWVIWSVNKKEGSCFKATDGLLRFYKYGHSCQLSKTISMAPNQQDCKHLPTLLDSTITSNMYLNWSIRTICCDRIWILFQYICCQTTRITYASLLTSIIHSQNQILTTLSSHGYNV
jgi:hypothetical protein